MQRYLDYRVAGIPLAVLVPAGLLACWIFACIAFWSIPTPDEEPGEQAALATPVETGLPPGASEEPSPTTTPTNRPTATNEPTEVATDTPAATHTRQPTRTPKPSPTVEISGSVPQGDLVVVTEVIDGDTIEVTDGTGFYRVRYIGMDTPERGDLFFDEATDANADLVAGRQVVLVKDVSETDQFGRLLRYVYLLDGTFVNAELVRLGFAQAATFPPDVAHVDDFLKGEREAREAGRGLWGEVAAAAPAATSVPATPAPTPLPTPLPTQPPPTAVPPTVAPTPLPTQPPPTQPPAPTATEAPPPTDPPVATGEVVISFIFFDGAVSRVESDEYAEISNSGGAPVNIGGWRLNAGYPGQDFAFPSFELGPGQSCRVYTNQVQPEFCGFSFGRGSAIWNNDGDCGYLYDNTGAEVDRYCY